jgi:hypothetical protein
MRGPRSGSRRSIAALSRATAIAALCGPTTAGAFSTERAAAGRTPCDTDVLFAIDHE